MLILIVGLPGTGKSTLASSLSKKINAVWLRSDVFRSAMFPEDTQASPKEQQLYSEEQGLAKDRAMILAAETLLKQKCSVIIDSVLSTNSSRKMFYELANRLSERLFIIQCTCPEETIQERMLRREREQASTPYKIANFGLYLKAKEKFEPFDREVLLADMSKPSDEIVSEVLSYLNKGSERMLLIFDVDRTLWDAGEFYAERRHSVYRCISKKYGFKFEDVKLACDLLIELHIKIREGGLTKAAIKFGLTKKEFFEALSAPDPSNFLQKNEELSLALKQLSKKHTLVAFSNTPKAAATKVLKALGIHECFIKVHGADDFESPKPNRTAFEQIASDQGFPNSTVVSIGDDIGKEILPAKELGFSTILVAADAQSGAADVVIPRIEDICTAVEDVVRLKHRH